MYPLKQGLRPLRNLLNKNKKEGVRIVNPLKQGLRRTICSIFFRIEISKNSESIKTRIETTMIYCFLFLSLLLGKNSESIKTRIGTKN